jgi:YggT family protein
MKPALIFIIDTLARLYLLVLLLRFWLPVLRADFRNPIAQGILRLTSPIVTPVRRIIPPIDRLDTATVLIAFALQYLTVLAILAVSGVTAGFVPIAITSLIDLVSLSLNLFTFAIFIHIILSWIAPGTYNPATAFITMLVQPLLRPFRNRIPSLGGLDLSPLIVIILLQACILLVGDYKPLPI